MASSWGNSWLSSWGSSWGGAPTPPAQADQNTPGFLTHLPVFGRRKFREVEEELKKQKTEELIAEAAVSAMLEIKEEEIDAKYIKMRVADLIRSSILIDIYELKIIEDAISGELDIMEEEEDCLIAVYLLSSRIH